MKTVNLKFSFLLLTVFIVFSSILNPINAQNLESKIDKLLLNIFKNKIAPGATFLIARKGSILYKKAVGLSNLELNVAMKPDHVFEIGSMTKQFTAISILMLVEKGQLKLEDEITKFIPDYPTNGHKITVHHLLTHTSGIKNFTSIKGLNAISKQDLTPLELIEFFKNEPMDFKPGEQFKYNNSGYILLGYIIEKITGQPYANFVEEQIFKKLKMTSSLYASHKKVIKNRASGYHKKEGYINNRDISFTLPYASGSLMSTVDDMFKWQEGIKNNLLINKETTEKVFTNYVLNNGENINYGYGWHIKTINGVSSFEHGGAIFGFKSMGVFLPELDIYVIGFSNCDCNSPTQVAKDIALLTLKETKKR